MSDEVPTDEELRLGAAEHLASMDGKLDKLVTCGTRYMKEERATHAALTDNLLVLREAIARWNSMAFKFLKWSTLALLTSTVFLILKLLEWI